MIMKNWSMNTLALMVFLFFSCSNDECLYSDANGVTVTGGKSKPSSQMESIDYEVVPVGEKSYVYMPKMTSVKAATRSIETGKTYSATVSGGLSSHYGPLSVTFTWDSSSASFHLSEGYTTTSPQFTYTIDGSNLSVSLTMTVWCDNVRLGDFSHSGTLRG